MYSLTSFFNRVEFYSSKNDYKMQKGLTCPYMACHARHTVTKATPQEVVKIKKSKVSHIRGCT